MLKITAIGREMSYEPLYFFTRPLYRNIVQK